jgi:hypothetical protein
MSDRRDASRIRHDMRWLIFAYSTGRSRAAAAEATVARAFAGQHRRAAPTSHRRAPNVISATVLASAVMISSTSMVSAR